MSGHGTPEEMQKEVDKWFKLSVGMYFTLSIFINIIDLYDIIIIINQNDNFIILNYKYSIIQFIILLILIIIF